ncbi:hypothetical protein [Streptomyces sp. CNQ085]|uniref:hypothetical protein n=1 Tax=Streptomyces sp. CNQ085 TaxID=2886944 RepID=UPI001F50DE53|nr:hypothetical protein [Streptomyces sp. CNQ085]MCI0387047.1 hypothetical protein [Streptomyces sp. CNQ085]
MQRHEAGAYVVLTLAAAGVGALGLVALLAALLDFLNSLTLAVSVSIPLAALATRRNAR